MDPVTATLFTQGIKSGSDLSGKIFDIGWQWYAMKKQISENQRVEELGLKLREEDIQRSEFWNTKEYKLALKKFGLSEEEMDLMQDKFIWQKSEAELDRKNANEIKNYQRIQGFAANMINQLNQNPQVKNNFLNIMGVRR